jgi:solute carrier family 35 (UDP-sugar transporter), member A1/2/3
MILKGVRVSLWTRNLQLAGYSVITAFIPLYASGQLSVVTEKGFFYGYTSMTWICIFMNAFGGLLVGTVIKYADAVTKDVAIGASIGKREML